MIDGILIQDLSYSVPEFKQIGVFSTYTMWFYIYVHIVPENANQGLWIHDIIDFQKGNIWLSDLKGCHSYMLYSSVEILNDGSIINESIICMCDIKGWHLTVTNFSSDETL